jgi:hypothetical protein
MKWALVFVLAAILLMPLSTMAMAPSYRGFSLPGPGGDYGVVEEQACVMSSTCVLLGPIKFCLPCGIETFGLLAFLGIGTAVAAVPAIRRKIENTPSSRELNKP